MKAQFIPEASVQWFNVANIGRPPADNSFARSSLASTSAFSKARSGLRRWATLIAAVAGCAQATSIFAASAAYDFTADPAGTLQIVGNNPLPWQSANGNPGGFLAITYPEGSQYAGVLFPDLDPGKIVTAFTFACDLRIGNPRANERPADGFSISFARGDDPLIGNLDATGNFAGGVPEAGSTTGIAVSFDTWAGNALPDGGDIEGVIVRVDNKTILRQALATRNGACNDVNSLQTGPRDVAYWDGGGDPQAPGSWAGLCWQPFSIDLTDSGKLTVKYKGRTILDAFQTTYFPSAGRLILAGRTGGADENTHIDNIKLTTTAIEKETVAPSVPGNVQVAAAGARRLVLTWAASTDNSGKVAYQIEKDGQLLPGFLTDPTFEDRAVKPNTSYAYRVRASDPSQNNSAWATVSAKTGVEADSIGFLVGEVYDNIGGTPVQGLYDDPKFPANPDRTVYLNGLSFGEPAFGNTLGESFGIRISGVLTAPETAQYDFFVRSDDASQLFLNPNGPALPVPGTDTPIAEETGCCAAFMEPGDPRTTASPIALTAGRQYGFVFIVKEGGGGDWGQVAMRKVGDSTPAAQLTPIRGALVSGKADPVGASVTITQPPQNTRVEAVQSATFSVGAQTASPYTSMVIYQWYRDGALIPGATQPSYTIPLVRQSDNGAKFKVLVAVPGASQTSAEAALTVDPDKTLPTISSVRRAFNDTSKVRVKFSEEVTSATANTAANYKIDKGINVTAAALGADNKTVELTTSAINPGTQATLTITGVQDLAGNAVGAGASLPIVIERGILFIVGSPDPNPADRTVKERLESQGYFVEVIDGPSSEPPMAEGKHLIVISSTVGSGSVAGKFDTVALPVVHWEPALQDNFQQTLDQDNVTRGVQLGTEINIVNPSHPLAACLPAGKVQVVKAEDNLAWGVPGPGAVIIAEHGNDPKRASIYFYDKGARLIDDSIAAEKRIYVFLFDNIAASWTAEGARLFDASIAFAQGLPVDCGPPKPAGKLKISQSGNNLQIAWDGAGALESADSITGPWTAVAGASSPHTVAPTGSGSAKFYRLRL